MAIEFAERDTSPELSLDGAVTRYWVMGETDELIVMNTLADALPIQLAGLIRTNIRIEPIGPGMWDAEITYGQAVLNATPQPAKPPEIGKPTFNFDTGGGTQHITQSLATIGSHAPPGKTAPDFKGAIGATTDSVEGVDIVIPVSQFSETHILADSVVTPDYKKALRKATGKVNSDSFREFAAGEVLFLGAVGTQLADDTWEVNFKFASSDNETGITVGDITGIDKKGWEYLWVSYEKEEDASSSSIVMRPIAAYVEKTYRTIAYASLIPGQPVLID